jgi:hypothetical protein
MRCLERPEEPPYRTGRALFPAFLWLALGGAAIVIMMLSSAYAAFVIRPQLADLPLTTERITRSDIFRAQATIYSTGLIVVLALCSLVLFVAGLFLGVRGKWDLTGILGTIFFAALTIYYVMLFFAKRRVNRQT